MILALNKEQYEKLKPLAELIIDQEFGSYLLIKGLLLHYCFTSDDIKEKEKA